MPDSLTIQLRYCASHVGKSLLWVAADFVTIYALVTLGAIDPHIAGALFIVGMTASAVADTATGWWIDRRPGREARLAAAGLIVAATMFPLTMIPTAWGRGGLLAATLMFRIAYAAYDVPHNALLSALAPVPAFALRLSRLRALGSGIAAGLVGAGLCLVSDRNGLIVLLVAIGIAAMLLGWMLMPLLRGGRVGKSGIDGTENATDRRRTIAFFVASIAGIVGLAMTSKGLLHLPAEAVSIDAGEMLILLTAGRTLAALLPLRPSWVGAGLTVLPGAYALAGLAILPVMANPGWKGGAFILGLAMGSANMIAWAMLPFVVRNAGGYGLYAMSIKIALGAAGLLMTGWLGSAAMLTTAGFLGLTITSVAACWLAALALICPSAASWVRGQRRAAAPGIVPR